MKYAALVSKSVTIPGDERSRTNPGHGYPEHTKSYTELVEFANKEALETWVKLQTTRGIRAAETFKLIQYEELKYETSISVKVSPS
jgi:hypothetical protein